MEYLGTKTRVGQVRVRFYHNEGEVKSEGEVECSTLILFSSMQAFSYIFKHSIIRYLLLVSTFSYGKSRFSSNS